jgi:hypothetical protein
MVDFESASFNPLADRPLLIGKTFSLEVSQAGAGSLILTGPTAQNNDEFYWLGFEKEVWSLGHALPTAKWPFVRFQAF